jgi:hypothetical protein
VRKTDKYIVLIYKNFKHLCIIIDIVHLIPDLGQFLLLLRMFNAYH